MATGHGRTRRVVMGALAGGAAGVVTACGAQAGGSSAQQGGAAAELQPAKLHAYVRQQVALFGDVMEKRVRAYETARQNKITVNWELVSTDYDKKLGALVAAGSPPDISDHSTDTFKPWAAQGVHRTLEPLVKRDKDFKLDEFFPRLIEGSRWQGQLARIPHYAAPYPMYFNRNLFRAKNVALPTADMTWQQLRETALKLTSKPESLWGFEADVDPNLWVSCIWGEGGEVLDKEGTKCLIDSPQAMAGVEFYANLRVRDRVALDSKDDFAGKNRDTLFAGGNVAMYVAPLSRANQLIELSKGAFEWDIQQPPRGSVKREQRLGDGGLSITAGSKALDQSWDFVKWMTSAETQKEWAGQRLNMPSRKAVAESDAFLKTRPPENTKAMVDMMATSRGFWPVPNRGMSSVLETGMGNIFAGKQGVREACQEMKRLIDAVIEKERPNWKPLAGV